MQDRKILVFLGYMDNPLSAAACLKKVCSDRDCVIVSMNRFTEELEKAAEIKIKYFNDFLEKDDYEYMQNYIFNISENWHKSLPIERDSIEFQGINILELLQENVYISLSTVMRNLHAILNILEMEKPSKAVLVAEKKEDGLGAISDFLMSTMGVESSYIDLKRKQRPSVCLNKLKTIKVLISDMASEVIDKLVMAYLVSGREGKNTILMDYRFAHIIKDIENEFYAISYIIEKGLKVRLKFLKKGRPYISFSKFNKFIDKRSERKYWKRIKGILRKNITEDKMFSYKDLCVYDVLEDIFRESIEKITPFLKANVSMLYGVFKSVKPKIMLVRDSTRIWEYTIISVGKNLRIPSVVIQHGAHTFKDIYSRNNADAMAAWGMADIEWYESAGNDMSKSKVTGAPTHDDIFNKEVGRSARYENILRSINADPKKLTVVYLGNCMEYYPSHSVHIDPDLSLYSLKITTEVFKNFNDIQLVIKLHPYYSRKKYPKFVKEIESLPNAFVTKDADIPDLFSGSVAVISELYSAAIIDAIILKKPVILYNFAKADEMMPFAKRGVGFEIKNRVDLKKAIENILSNNAKESVFTQENVDSFIADYAYKIDGKSSGRVKDFIRELALQ